MLLDLDSIDEDSTLSGKYDKILYKILVTFCLFMLSLQGQKQQRVDFLQRQMTVQGFQKIYSYMNYSNNRSKSFFISFLLKQS